MEEKIINNDLFKELVHYLDLSYTYLETIIDEWEPKLSQYEDYANFRKEFDQYLQEKIKPTFFESVSDWIDVPLSHKYGLYSKVEN